MSASASYYARAAELRARAAGAFFERTRRKLRRQAHDLEQAGWAASQAERLQRAAAWDARRCR
jgi:hypothetical protein